MAAPVGVTSTEKFEPSAAYLMGRSSPIITNTAGGKQSSCPRLSLIPRMALFGIASRFALGEGRYTKNNWRLIDTASHLEHVEAHLSAYLDMCDRGLDQVDGETRIDHLRAMACRAMMALEIAEQGGSWGGVNEDGSRAS